MIIDTHAHYDDERFDDDREELLTGMKAKGIDIIVNASATVKGCFDSLALAEKYDFVYTMAGIHPSDTLDLEEPGVFEEIKKVAAHKKCVAIGEIGLDYYWDEPDREIQKKWFAEQLDFAKEIGKPVNIHSRDAAADTLDIMKAEGAKDLGGIIHCFSYGTEMAKEYLNMGFHIGVGGVITFKNGKKLKEVVEYAPLDRIVLETDCPYLAPEPYRGKRNQSDYLHMVAEEIANIKNITKEEVVRITRDNALRVYGINV
ncbi:MAG: TatD family hydrolase [Lachnospiraceae bacterium]|nr:TatD family hydrolase [Lachnospiraceae bacterium]